MIKAELLIALEPYKQTDIQQFVLKNPLKLASEELKWAASQLHFWKKIKEKIPSWAENQALLSPPSLSIEQASSEQTAIFKSKLLRGKIMADLTGGMGIDAYFFSKQFEKVHYVEQQTELAETTAYNFEQLGVSNISVYNQPSEDFIAKTQASFDVIYLDPARRNEKQQKVFQVTDCEPNIENLKTHLFEKTSQILIKYSPLLDIKLAINQLENVQEVWVVAMRNEVKELLFLLDKNTTHSPEIRAINLLPTGQQEFVFSYKIEQQTEVAFSLPQTYLYEPNAAIMKAGAFKSIAAQYSLKKLAPNSHLYTNDTKISDFQGRVFEVIATLKFDKKQIIKALNSDKANITCRNFPLKPDELKQQLRIKDGGENYLFFTEDMNKNKCVILCRQVAF